ncbi:uncharacterized protein AMSG_12065 [Thecamonas trahens ATCC 50062]|uniref:Protein kinase domain-containing protein n=1 Tax=Thecamonas trahens ATCC 50062 TaxID=461836 RepID=A0A0L0DG42_THETB|nr:hypothetical protein AMSG_12065 [Thecamonas trahens ATCC 50062]KNC51294.1 hypothetical protein AMSG_12065 [Thecamonas trahens ATCC 50062]|eukprot:XP_013756304.1 hypothetical protein AMSG_12065 [Thecamonas trahens ATCC 50062]
MLMGARKGRYRKPFREEAPRGLAKDIRSELTETVSKNMCKVSIDRSLGWIKVDGDMVVRTTFFTGRRGRSRKVISGWCTIEEVKTVLRATAAYPNLFKEMVRLSKFYSDADYLMITAPGDDDGEAAVVPDRQLSSDDIEPLAGDEPPSVADLTGFTVHGFQLWAWPHHPSGKSRHDHLVRHWTLVAGHHLLRSGWFRADELCAVAREVVAELLATSKKEALAVAAAPTTRIVPQGLNFVSHSAAKASAAVAGGDGVGSASRPSIPPRARWTSLDEVPVHGPYERRAVLGAGQYGVVLLVALAGSDDAAARAAAVDNHGGDGGSDGEVYCMKVIDVGSFSAQELMHAMAEVTVLGAMHCATIVDLRESWVEDDDLVIVMEAALSGDVESLVESTRVAGGRLDADVVWMWAIELLLAARHIHTRGIIHRDIKAENVFLTGDGHVKLGDFGISVAQTDIDDDDQVSALPRFGTPYYLAPEFFGGASPRAPAAAAKRDMWALGVVLFRMLTLRFPFEASSMRALRRVIKHEPAVVPRKAAPPALASLVEELLCKDPAERPSADELLSRPEVRTRMMACVPEALYLPEFPDEAVGHAMPDARSHPMAAALDAVDVPSICVGLAAGETSPLVGAFSPLDAAGHPYVRTPADYFAVAEHSETDRERAFAPLAGRLAHILLTEDLGEARARRAERLLKRTHSSQELIDSLREHLADASEVETTPLLAGLAAEDAGQRPMLSPRLSSRLPHSPRQRQRSPATSLGTGTLSTASSTTLDSDDELTSTSFSTSDSDAGSVAGSDGSQPRSRSRVRSMLTAKLIEKLEQTRRSPHFRALNSVRRSYLRERRRSLVSLPTRTDLSPSANRRRAMSRPSRSNEELLSPGLMRTGSGSSDGSCEHEAECGSLLLSVPQTK